MLSCFRSFLPPSYVHSLDSDANSLDEKQSSHLETDRDSEGEVGPRYSPLASSHATHRLNGLRKHMSDASVEVYVIPTADAHNSEYVGDCDKRRAWLSGFTGSAGVAVVTADRALLFTDSRYYTQAGHELDASLWCLQKVGEKDVKNWNAWLIDPALSKLAPGSKVGVDGSTIDYATAKQLSEQLHAIGLSLVVTPSNLVDLVWGSARPAREANPIVDHPLKFAGKSASDKLTDLRTFLTKTYPSPAPVEGSPSPAPPPSFLLTSLNPLAWLLNLRTTGDIAFNPVFYGYLLVRPAVSGSPFDDKPEGEGKKVVLWVQKKAVTEALRKRVEEELDGEIREYENAVEDLRKLAEGEDGEKVVGDGKVSFALASAIGPKFRPLTSPNPVDAAQAIKNATEIAGFRAAYERDGVAWVRWIAELEERLVHKKERVTEWDAAERLTRFREGGENFAGLAYENISATGENAALPHYAPSPGHPIDISLETPYLNDSGAQYFDSATIDTTRTYHFSASSRRKPAQFESHSRAFTRVLQGHIAIDRLKFPEGTTGEQIDVLARAALWSEEMDYGHGTGHGVGAYGSVHETQVGISHSAAYFNIPFLPGHITSNEPAFYSPGKGGFGIRIESVLCVKELHPGGGKEGKKAKAGEGNERKWYGFERMTCVPIQSTFVAHHLLTPAESTWLKQHNQTIKDRLLPRLREVGDQRAVRWLKRQ